MEQKFDEDDRESARAIFNLVEQWDAPHLETCRCSVKSTRNGYIVSIANLTRVDASLLPGDHNGMLVNIDDGMIHITVHRKQPLA